MDNRKRSSFFLFWRLDCLEAAIEQEVVDDLTPPDKKDGRFNSAALASKVPVKTGEREAAACDECIEQCLYG